MPYFYDTVETIDAGLGFTHFDGLHMTWLAAAVIVIGINVFLYGKLSDKGRDIWRKLIAIALVADELFKTAILLAGQNYTLDYLPLHLCSINIFVIAYHCLKPNNTVGNFLYMVCLPGALAALLFPSWAALPITAGMHIHSFTVHIMLVMYPLVLALNKDVKIGLRSIPKSFLILLIMAGVIYLLNLLLHTNFMFLMFAEEGNPLYLFEKAFGSHLIGFPVIIAGVLIVLYGPLELVRRLNKKA